MQSLYLKGKRTLKLEDNEQVTIKYYLVEEREVRSKPLYGISLVQYSNQDHVVAEYTEPLSYCKVYVEKILDKLIEHSVLVSNFIETVDDLVV